MRRPSTSDSCFSQTAAYEFKCPSDYYTAFLAVTTTSSIVYKCGHAV
jgi:hypothetical protein